MKRFICILLASVMGLCCFSCADSKSDSSPMRIGFGYRVRSLRGNSVYSYYYYPQKKIVLSVGETYILEAVFLLLSLHGNPSTELSWSEHDDVWIEEYDENCLQITRRYDLDNDFGRYYELVPICETDDTSFVIRFGERVDHSYVGAYAEVQIVA